MNGKPEGKGILIGNGFHFEGEFKNGLKHGEGKLIIDGVEYDG